MTTRIMAAIAAATIALAGAASPVAGATKPPAYVDMDDDGRYSAGDLRIDRIGSLRRLDRDRVLVGSVGSGDNRFTLVYVVNGHDLHVDGRIAGHNLAIVNRGGDIVIGPRATIAGTGPQFALATRRGPTGDAIAGTLDIRESARVAHTYSSARARQVQIEAGDLRLGAGVDVSSLPARDGRTTARADRAAEVAHVKVTGSIDRHPTATVRGLPVVLTKQP